MRRQPFIEFALSGPRTTSPHITHIPKQGRHGNGGLSPAVCSQKLCT